MDAQALQRGISDAAIGRIEEDCIGVGAGEDRRPILSAIGRAINSVDRAAVFPLSADGRQQHTTVSGLHRDAANIGGRRIGRNKRPGDLRPVGAAVG